MFRPRPCTRACPRAASTRIPSTAGTCPAPRASPCTRRGSGRAPCTPGIWLRRPAAEDADLPRLGGRDPAAPPTTTRGSRGGPACSATTGRISWRSSPATPSLRTQRAVCGTLLLMALSPPPLPSSLPPDDVCADGDAQFTGASSCARRSGSPVVRHYGCFGLSPQPG